PLDEFKQRRSSLRCRVDVEEGELIRAVLGIFPGQGDRIPLVPQLLEMRPLHDPSAGGVEAGDDSLEQHWNATRPRLRRPQIAGSSRAVEVRRSRFLPDGTAPPAAPGGAPP